MLSRNGLVLIFLEAHLLVHVSRLFELVVSFPLFDVVFFLIYSLSGASVVLYCSVLLFLPLSLSLRFIVLCV